MPHQADLNRFYKDRSQVVQFQLGDFAFNSKENYQSLRVDEPHHEKNTNRIRYNLSRIAFIGIYGESRSLGKTGNEAP
jgi:hypothetical protein